MTATLIAQVAIGGLLMGLVYALIAAGLSLIFGLMDVVNFAHGELLMLAMYAAFVIRDTTGLGILVQLPIVALLLFVAGALIYRGLIARALGVRFNSGMVQIFVTFGLSIFLVGAAQVIFGSDFVSVDDGALSHRTVGIGQIVLPLGQVMAGLVCLLAFAALILIFRTEFGRALEATREDRDAVACVTVALGGFGSLVGALVAGLAIGLVEALTALFIDPSLKQVGIFAMYVLVLMVKPRGLFGRL
jgi:branched-chain amino acid transport system permease protein